MKVLSVVREETVVPPITLRFFLLGLETSKSKCARPVQGAAVFQLLSAAFFGVCLEILLESMKPGPEKKREKEASTKSAQARQRKISDN